MEQYSLKYWYNSSGYTPYTSIHFRSSRHVYHCWKTLSPSLYCLSRLSSCVVIVLSSSIVDSTSPLQFRAISSLVEGFHAPKYVAKFAEGFHCCIYISMLRMSQIQAHSCYSSWTIIVRCILWNPSIRAEMRTPLPTPSTTLACIETRTHRYIQTLASSTLVSRLERFHHINLKSVYIYSRSSVR